MNVPTPDKFAGFGAVKSLQIKVIIKVIVSLIAKSLWGLKRYNCFVNSNFFAQTYLYRFIFKNSGVKRYSSIYIYSYIYSNICTKNVSLQKKTLVESCPSA